MWRSHLITKEAMEKYCKGEDDDRKDSVNDDLESFFEDLRLGKEPNEEVLTYFLPKLTKEEMELVKRKDTNYLKTFMLGDHADVEEAEMNLSESDSKFIDAFCHRRTSTIEIPVKSYSYSSYDASYDASYENCGVDMDTEVFENRGVDVDMDTKFFEKRGVDVDMDTEFFENRGVDLDMKPVSTDLCSGLF